MGILKELGKEGTFGTLIAQFRRSNVGIALQALAVVTVLLFATTNANADITLNLTTVGTSGVINGATYTQGDTGASSGTGIFPAFVRIQAPTTEEGYNTPVGGVFDNTNDATHNLNVRLSDLGTVTCGATTCFQFFLDINESGGGQEFLSLDDIQIRTGTTASPTTETLSSLGTLRYQMDSPGTSNNTVLLDFSLEAGSGKSDMTLLVPVSLFGGALQTDFLYLYSHFGSVGGVYDSSDGFEEWSFRAGSGFVPIPEPSTYALYALGAAMLFVSGWWQKRRTAYDSRF
jgi:hypothetical protein